MHAVDERLHRTSPIRSLRLGDATVTYVPDGEVRLKPYGWLPQSTELDWRDGAGYLADDGNLVASVGVLLVEHHGRTLMIDAGLGPVFRPDDPGNLMIGLVRGGELLDHLAELGRRPADVEAVAITHLHFDHVGWAVHPVPGGGAAFPEAAYLVSAPEWEHRRLSTIESHRVELDVMAPRVRTFGDGEEIFPGVRAMLTPGHTAGTTTYVIASGGLRLVVSGDVMHSPAQIRHPDWTTSADVDPVQAAASRRRVLEELLRADTLGCGGHFADVIFGRLTDTPAGLSWQPAL
ncbi:MBL fold metallo-hydrolase [Nonomuraea aridisoli]|uniref:MBL fold metallo-hydrolase n=1 Tax=Nonomuraea aridisoli TaxID=2070368 RepID=A0A2W2DNK1_9ACTN|nr:MBL fold metallo-hydrolase [Nonomuraea aridisoli]PZG05669.1 MBL fold metallo-hydrolase [Nonomuraea aridisoli]